MSKNGKSIVSIAVITVTLLAGISVLIASAEPDPPIVSEPTTIETSTTVPPTTLPPTTVPPETLPPETVPPETFPETTVPPTTAPPVTEPPVVEPTSEPVITGATPIEYWDRMAQCETGGNWAHYPYGTWTGGLGIYNQTWLGWGGGEFAPTAGQATKEQQIIVAERIAADVGYSAWGCAATIGYP